MSSKLFIVLVIMAALALTLAVTAISMTMFGKRDPRYWMQAETDRQRGEVFFWSSIAALLLGAAAWIVQP